MSHSDILSEIPWETRNLHIPAFQISAPPDALALREAIDRAARAAGKEFFIQTKIPASDIKAIRNAESAGFHLAEMTIDPWTEVGSSGVYAKYLKQRASYGPKDIACENIKSTAIASHKMSDSDRKSIVSISEDVFVADRFHMDPSCPEEIANKRMKLWIEHDLLSERQATMCTITRYGQEVVGYIFWKKDRFILGGLSKSFIGKGFSKLLYLDAMKDVHEAGASTLSTTISVNNLAVMNLYARLGFSFRDPAFTLHYWSRAS